MNKNWIIALMAGSFFIINSAIQFIASRLFYINQSLVFFGLIWIIASDCPIKENPWLKKRTFILMF